jgi:hypothetical protein
MPIPLAPIPVVAIPAWANNSNSPKLSPMIPKRFIDIPPRYSGLIILLIIKKPVII